MPRPKKMSSSKSARSANIARQREAGVPLEVATARSFRKQRKAKKAGK